ncbi:MAG: 1-acyl-sn-glycerol-3-phosphate acyltransferase [Deltaproteobacteria bacterium]|nr:1-acyl-sn-glycerol-3-phosphate acyltransferase [Deltaproteobacteria bacterium]MBN2670955.1 1-acyl-sn-glycerol-3-phosphate acyltransferase [Deltaproteobacteria bacterium]
MENYDDIRPYADTEVNGVLARLIADKELLDTVAKMKLPRMQPIIPPLARTVVKAALRQELCNVADVKSFQQIVKKYMDRMIESTTSDFSVGGIDDLKQGNAYLFMSNHRDIALDPAFVSYALYHNDHETVRIAIGDNLLSKPFASDLMRLNKSFIVNRSAIGRQMLAAYKKLSEYIRFSLLEERESIWIAQREGRAKDSLDKTEPAIMKMLSMSRDRKTETLSGFISSLQLVPISISYEWDPCDVAKVIELSHKADGGVYEKEEHEDLKSIGQGITGRKGAVHVHFGEVVAGEFETPEQVADAVDQQIWRNYVLHPSNLVAYEMRYGTVPDVPVGKDEEVFVLDRHVETKSEMERRLSQVAEEQRELLLDIYANPVLSKLKSAR